MPFTTVIVASVLIYVWLVEGRAADELVYIPGGIVVGLTVWHNASRREWGFSWRRFWPGLGLTLALSLVLCLLILAVGAAAGTLHDRRDFLGNFAPLIVWGGAQQWVLQTVVLREAQRTSSRRGGIAVAALLFGAVHLPNPFLAPVTAAAALLWCWLYDRYPNVIPLALSHALGTMAVLYAFDAGITGRLRIGAAFLRL
jgi:membrane protease YdiL (CAAX protease family)